MRNRSGSHRDVVFVRGVIARCRFAWIRGARRCICRAEGTSHPRRRRSQDLAAEVIRCNCAPKETVLHCPLMNRRREIVFTGVVFLASCSSSSLTAAGANLTSAGADLNNFTGAWTIGTATIHGDCGDDGVSQMASEMTNAGGVITLFASGSSGLTLGSTPACVYDFTVTGDTATLANGPVTCSKATDAGLLTGDIMSFTLSTPDGQNLTATATATATATEDGTTCTVMLDFTATRPPTVDSPRSTAAPVCAPNRDTLQGGT